MCVYTGLYKSDGLGTNPIGYNDNSGQKLISINYIERKILIQTTVYLMIMVYNHKVNTILS